MDQHRGARVRKARVSGTVPWCSGLAYVPVKDEIAGSNPVGTASVAAWRSETPRNVRSDGAGIAGPVRVSQGIVTLKRNTSSSGPSLLLFRVSDQVMYTVLPLGAAAMLE